MLFSFLFPSFFSCSGIEHREISIKGLWNQYMLVENDYIYGGTFRVSFADGKYYMEYAEKRSTGILISDRGIIEVRNSASLFDISFKNRIWMFKSDWGNGDIGLFRLTMTGDGVFEGWSYLEGKKRS